jgi:hypothetical protein
MRLSNCYELSTASSLLDHSSQSREVGENWHDSLGRQLTINGYPMRGMSFLVRVELVAMRLPLS